MAKKRGRPKKQPVIEEQNCHEEAVPLEKKDEAFDSSEGIFFPPSAIYHMLCTFTYPRTCQLNLYVSWMISTVE